MSDKITIDVRGLSCPEPAIAAKRALREQRSGTIEVLVDCGASVDNVSRTARLAGWCVEEEKISDTETCLVMRK